jgi:hypothetical protein
MAKYDVIYEYSNGETAYRIRPNPDAGSGSGYEFGGVLEWKDVGEKEWSGYFFLAPDSIAALGEALIEASKHV